jgi:glycosyltransferase involved in cell wall biosynthesis
VKDTVKVTFYIVTPSFNQAQFISQTIESVLSQDVKVQYWIMDGKSSDLTVAVLKSFGRKIHWLSEKDKGQTDAINKSIKKCAALKPKPSDIFAYINSDDYYIPEALNNVVQAFAQSPDKQWLVGDALIINEKNEEIQPLVRQYKSVLRRLLSLPLLLVLNPIPQPAVFIKWAAVEKVGLFNAKLRYVMDYEYWLRLMATVGMPLVLDQPLAAFRIHGASKGGTQFIHQFDEELSVAQRFTKNSAWLFFHTVHNEMVKLVYRLIK